MAKKKKHSSQLSDDELANMMIGIAEFIKHHDWQMRFGENKDLKMTPENAGLITIRLSCGCRIELGIMDDGTYHLHSMLIKEKKKGRFRRLFTV